MAKVFDAFTYNGETAMLKLHLSILDKYVDKFVIVESNKTFSGNDKPLYFFRDQRYFKQWWKKIHYYVVNDWDNVELWQRAIDSPNTKGASHWKREWFIKEHIHEALKECHPENEDTVFIGDVDEIVNPLASYEGETPLKAKLRVFAYQLNNESSEKFHGTLIAQYKDIQGKCLNHLRSDKKLYSDDYLGWHFTSMGGLKEVQRKLNDSYTTDSYNTYDVQQKLPERLKDGEDYLGRHFRFTQSEEHWPDYLKKHKKEFEHLCK